jgi:hypothetical protein
VDTVAPGWIWFPSQRTADWRADHSVGRDDSSWKGRLGLRLHAAVAAALRDHDIDFTFGLMGDANMLSLVMHVPRGG